MTTDAPNVPDLSAYTSLLARVHRAEPVDAQVSSMVDEAVGVWSRPGFDTLLARAGLRFEPFDYQLAAAQTVLRRMRGRAILADEVGLGKTIEAGLVLSELRMRGLADRTLVLTPAGLVEQWQEELERKFALPTTVVTGRTVVESSAADRQVQLASIATARRDPTRCALTAEPWDLVIVDEAHRVRGARSASGKLARELRARYLLLLTATPVENTLRDLYELVSLVAPGLLGTPTQFRSRHGGNKEDVTTARNINELRHRIREVMVRHRRSEVSLMLPQRLAETALVTPSEDEAALYTDLTSRIRAEAQTAGAAHRLTLRSLTRLAAVAPTLKKIGWTDLAERANAIHHSEKSRLLIERLRPYAEREEKVVVFTAFRQTLDALATDLEAAGIPAAIYHGSLSRQDKEKAVAAFRDEVPVLLSTESAGEGRNLQFCHVMMNVDLPWNPMQIEQRHGRLHRVGSATTWC